MLQSFSIHGYKQFSELKLDKLSNLNFFVGNNNMGKTTILEAVFAWACGLNINAIMAGIAQKYSLMGNPYSLAESIYSLANDRSKEIKIEFSGEYDNEIIAFIHNININGLYLGDSSGDKDFNINNKLSMQETVVNNNNGFLAIPNVPNRQIVAKWSIRDSENKIINHEIAIPGFVTQEIQPYKFATFMDLLAHRLVQQINMNYSQLKRKGLLESVVERMRTVFPEVEAIDMIPYPDGSTAPISVKTKNKDYLPMYSFGDGFQRWFYIISTTVLSKNSIICIDEIDATLHPSAQADFCRNLIYYAAEYNVQIFATTHNMEFIDAFLGEYSKYKKNHEDYEARIVTLKKIDGQTRIRNLSGEDALQLRDEFELELR